MKLKWCSRVCNTEFKLEVVYISPGYTCIVSHVKLTWCSRAPYVCILEYAKVKWCIDTEMLLMGCSCLPEMYCHLGGDYICPRYMCILLHVKLLWCSDISYIYHQFEQGTSTHSIFAFYASMVNCSGGLHLPSIYVHSAICETYEV